MQEGENMYSGEPFHPCHIIMAWTFVLYEILYIFILYLFESNLLADSSKCYFLSKKDLLLPLKWFFHPGRKFPRFDQIKIRWLISHSLLISWQSNHPPLLVINWVGYGGGVQTIPPGNILFPRNQDNSFGSDGFNGNDFRNLIWYTLLELGTLAP